jgi:hypothetical protein
VTGVWLLSAGGEVYLVVAAPDRCPRWAPVADVLLQVTPGADSPTALLARYPGASAVAQAGSGEAVTLVHRNGWVAAAVGPPTAPAVRAVTLLRLARRHASRCSSRRTCTASTSASRT